MTPGRCGRGLECEGRSSRGWREVAWCEETAVDVGGLTGEEGGW